MALQEKMKCYWHAFDALDEQKTDQVQKSRLKVLTFNTASILGMQKAEEGLTDFHSTPYLSFKNYLYFLNVEVFQKLEEDTLNAVDLNKIDDVCWLVCLKKYVKRDPKIIDDDGAFKLWKMFNFLAETNSEGEPIFPLFMDHEEVKFLLQRLVQILGCAWNDELLAEVSSEIQQFSFAALLNVIETRFSSGTDSSGMAIAVKELYEEFIMDIIKKGILSKKGHLMKNWNDRWFVLTPTKLRYFPNRMEKELKGEMTLSKSSKIEVLNDRGSSKQYRFLIKGTEGKHLEIHAPDLRHRNEWTAAIQSAIDHTGNEGTFRKVEFLMRKKCRDKKREEKERKRKEEEDKTEKQRQELESAKKAHADLEAKLADEEKLRLAEQERLRLEEEERKKLEDERLKNEEKRKKEEDELKRKEEEEKAERQREELELARKAHAELQSKLDEEAKLRASEQEQQRRIEEEMKQKQLDLEARLEEEAALREAEQQRLRELEELNRKLEELLETERQAKKDEEIVRALQARLLEEEFAKREELEHLKEQQEELLAKERQEKQMLTEEKQSLTAEKEMLAEEKQSLALEKTEQERILKEEQERLEILKEEREAADTKLQEALEKLEKAEKLKKEIQARKLEREKPIGLARLIQPRANPLITHRGLGAFTSAEFELRKQKSQESFESSALHEANNQQLEERHLSNGNASEKSMSELKNGENETKTELVSSEENNDSDVVAV